MYFISVPSSVNRSGTCPTSASVTAVGPPPPCSSRPYRKAPTHIERHRHMFMGDHPLAVDLATADGCAHPDIGFLAVAPRSADPVKAAAEADVIACGDVEVANLVANRTSETGKPFLEALL